MNKNPNFPANKVELKPNSDRSKREAVKPVVTGKVTKKKSSVGKKFADIFLSEDIGDVKRYILCDVLIPGIKDGLYDIFSGTINMLFYGDAGSSRSRKGRSSGNGYVSYSSYYSGGKKTERKAQKGVFSLDEIIFEDKDDVMEVKYGLMDLMERYNVVTVSEYYDLAEQPHDWAAGDFGWYDLTDMQVMRDRDGWKLKMPRVEQLAKKGD